ncbi:MAG: hypothetical protein EOP58_04485 [Sphingomonadales bacterium]|nr:MAG: hypothetical protein EOP58_04485 [Sphingomonadales bacterium]
MRLFAVRSRSLRHDADRGRQRPAGIGGAQFRRAEYDPARDRAVATGSAGDAAHRRGSGRGGRRAVRFAGRFRPRPSARRHQHQGGAPGIGHQRHPDRRSRYGRDIGSPPQGFDLEARVIGQRRMKLAVPNDHRFANRDRLHFRELHDEAFVLMVQPHNIRLAVDMMMNDFGVRPSVMHEMSTQRTVVEMARRCGAIGFADDEIIASAADGEVKAVELDPPTEWNINLIHRRDRKFSQVFTAFLNWLQEAHPVGATRPGVAG